MYTCIHAYANTQADTHTHTRTHTHTYTCTHAHMHTRTHTHTHSHTHRHTHTQTHTHTYTHTHPNDSLLKGTHSVIIKYFRRARYVICVLPFPFFLTSSCSEMISPAPTYAMLFHAGTKNVRKLRCTTLLVWLCRLFQYSDYDCSSHYGCEAAWPHREASQIPGSQASNSFRKYYADNAGAAASTK